MSDITRKRDAYIKSVIQKYAVKAVGTGLLCRNGNREKFVEKVAKEVSLWTAGMGKEQKEQALASAQQEVRRVLRNMAKTCDRQVSTSRRTKKPIDVAYANYPYFYGDGSFTLLKHLNTLGGEKIIAKGYLKVDQGAKTIAAGYQNVLDGEALRDGTYEVSFAI